MRILDHVERLHSALDYHLTRHNVLVSNLAQMETPGHTSVDLARSDFDRTMKVALRATHAGHFGGATGAMPGRIVKDRAAKGGADGNTIDIDREAVKIASNQVRYDVLAQLTSGALTSLTWAAGDGRGA
jgi:flagellar basal-body rod protein FlgB